MPKRKKKPVLVSYPTYLLFLPLSLTIFEKLHTMINATNFPLNIAHISILYLLYKPCLYKPYQRENKVLTLHKLGLTICLQTVNSTWPEIIICLHMVNNRNTIDLPNSFQTTQTRLTILSWFRQSARLHFGHLISQVLFSIIYWSLLIKSTYRWKILFVIKSM